MEYKYVQIALYIWIKFFCFWYLWDEEIWS